MRLLISMLKSNVLKVLTIILKKRIIFYHFIGFFSPIHRFTAVFFKMYFCVQRNFLWSIATPPSPRPAPVLNFMNVNNQAHTDFTRDYPN